MTKACRFFNEFDGLARNVMKKVLSATTIHTVPYRSRKQRGKVRKREKEREKERQKAKGKGKAKGKARKG
jgi:hypothetical protein